MAKAKKKAKRKTAAKRKTSTRRKSAAKRTLVAPRGNKRFVRRKRGGQFDQVDDVSRSLSNDRRRKAKKKAKRGQGDKGDR
jgi:hypothetical protein